MHSRVDTTLGPRSALDATILTREKHILAMVQEAVKRRQVLLAYQPVVLARNPNPIAYYEGLIRVLDDTGRIIPAREFINEVEDTETGRLLDCLALEKGLAVLAREPGLRLAINMSARSIGYRRWMRTLERGLDGNPTVAERLIVEITETSAMPTSELVVQFMSRLKSRGISFALDDFGAGYTAFRHFKEFSFDILKIDGQFIRGIAQDPDNQVITRAMLSIARQFDMLTVAEFVERAEDAAFLADMGIDCLQGYYYGAPTVTPHWEADLRIQA